MPSGGFIENPSDLVDKNILINTYIYLQSWFGQTNTGILNYY